MLEDLRLNVHLLRRRVPNLTVAAKTVGLRPATVSDLCNGKIPLGRAEVKTLVALADLAGCSLDELVLRGTAVDMIETGIKTLDLFAPLVRGGSVGLVARHGMGQLTMLAELLRRLRQRGFATVMWLPEKSDTVTEEAAAEAEATGTAPDQLFHQIAQFRTDRDVLLAADRAMLLSGELDRLKERLQAETQGYPVTFALVDALGEAPDEDVPYGPLETLWRFDADLTARQLFPAIDPVASTSTLSEGAYLEASHLAIQQRARKLLRRYRELNALVRVRGEERLPEAERLTYARGQRLEAFLTQLIYVAEPFTKQAGQWVTPAETIEGVRRILEGAADELESATLKYQGPLPQSPGRGA